MSPRESASWVPKQISSESMRYRIVPTSIWYVSNVSIIYEAFMQLYYLFWMFMGFIIHFYITFGTNLLTGGPTHIVVLLPVSVFRRKGISNGVQTEWNLRQRDFLEEYHPGDLEFTSEDPRGGQESGGRAHPSWARPLSRGPLGRPPTYFFLLYMFTYPANIHEHHETLFPPPQPSVPKRSHLGAFFGAPLEGESIMEGIYINTIAPPMSCE